MSNIVHKVKEVLPGTQENKIAKATDGSAATGYNTNTSAGGLGSDGYGSTTTGGSAYGSGAAAPDYNTGGVGTGIGSGVAGEHHGHHHHGGHHHGHHGHAHGGVTGSTVDTPQEGGVEKVAKLIPGTEANKEHKLNQGTGGAGYDSTSTGAGYGSTGTGTGAGYASNDNLGSAGGYGSTGTGLTGQAGHGATGGNFGAVDTSRETTTQGVAKHIPGTDANKEHKLNTEGTTGYGSTGTGASYGSTGTGTTSTGTGYGSTGTTGTGTGLTGGNTTIGEAHPSTKDKLLSVIPGTEANKEKKALKAAGEL